VESFNISGGRVQGSTTGSDTATGSYKAGGIATATNGNGLASSAHSGVFGALTGSGNGIAHSLAASYSAAHMTSHGIQTASLSFGRASATPHAFASYHASASGTGDGAAMTPIGAGPIGVASNASANGSVGGAGTASSFSFDHSGARIGTANGTTTLAGTSVSRGGLSTSGNGTAAFNSSGISNVSLASGGSPVASVGVNSSAAGRLPGSFGTPFDAIGVGGANATGNSNTGSVSTHANTDESAFGGPSMNHPGVTLARATGAGHASVAITP